MQWHLSAQRKVETFTIIASTTVAVVCCSASLREQINLFVGCLRRKYVHHGSVKSDTNRKLYISGLSRSTTERDVEVAFAQYGEIAAAVVRKGNYAFVEYKNRQDAESALHGLNGAEC